MAKDGIPLNLFTPINNRNGEQEPQEILRGRIVSLLSKSADLAPTQELSLMTAVESVAENGLYDTEGIRAVYDALILQDTHNSLTVAAKLRPFFDTNILRTGKLFDDRHAIVELDLNDLEYDHQLVLVNFILDYILRISQKGVFIDNGFTLFIDEAQNLTFSSNSPIYNLMNESRKQNIQLLLAAPSLTAGNKRGMDIVQQSGTCLYFKPFDSDLKKTADLIDAKNEKFWAAKLSRLQRGQFIAVGSFSSTDRTITRPIQLTTYLTESVS